MTADGLEADDIDDETVDKYLNAELIIDVGTGDERRGRVAHCLIRGSMSLSLLMGRPRTTLQSNVIAENMYAQVDSEGRQYQLLHEIVDHRANNTAVPIEDGFTVSRNGNCVPKLTTRGWSLLVNWKDGSSDWVKLKDLNDLYAVQIAEYAVANCIADQPAFNWWVHSVLQKRNRIVAKIKSRYWKTTHKFGIRVPKTVQEPLVLDEELGTDFWKRALNKEMTKVKVAWKAVDGVTPEQVCTGKVKQMVMMSRWISRGRPDLSLVDT